ncbi:MAG: hypothetical protein UD936_08025 [Acutalibacteraceae bacterium]|nr:hypothetical protein [Acutalibacteraceae bacterium]
MQPNIENSIAINCFAMNNGKCSILTNTNCVCCKFFKTKHQLKIEHEECEKRLNGKE